MTQYDFRWAKYTAVATFWGPSDLDNSTTRDLVTSQRETTILCICMLFPSYTVIMIYLLYFFSSWLENLIMLPKHLCHFSVAQVCVFSTCKCRYVIKMIFCFVCIWYLIIDGKDKMQYELKKTPVKDLFIFCIDFCKGWERVDC